MIRKIITGVIGGFFLTSLVATSAFADVTAEISGNGAGSYNSVYIKHKNECSVYQKNKTEVLTEVDSSAHSGANQANGNTGGDVTIDTGNATSTVTVQVDGGSNIASNPCCCECQTCDPHLWGQGEGITISGNGVESVSSVTIKKKKSSSLKQKNITEVAVGVLSKAKTGKNKAKNNTNGTVEVTTGNASSTVEVTVTSSSNTLF